ncbi:Hint domain-containing protein [Gymnodinialimonas hymeniacidonis]|uniref:Hint domain-containing protein n=1 Tax=Gymnodinialimonas hymeniacidonis TaxID=3126508 RepID=UPI0034C64C19
MPTKYTDQFYVIDPFNGVTPGSTLTPQIFDFFDNDDNGIIQPNAGDTVLQPGSDPEVFNEITAVWYGDSVTVLIGGVEVEIFGATFYITGQPAIFTPYDGTILQSAEFVRSNGITPSTELPVGELGPPCFTPGTMIDTPDGARAVEALRPGDVVLTEDHGPQELLWIGSRTVRGTGRYAQVVFEDGAIGNTGELAVSPQHRMLVEGWRAELLFAADRVLVPAIALVNETSIRRVETDSVTYIHLLFRDHEIVRANGVPTESYFIGHLAAPQERATRTEVLELFPELKASMDELTMAYPALRVQEARAAWT